MAAFVIAWEDRGEGAIFTTEARRRGEDRVITRSGDRVIWGYGDPGIGKSVSQITGLPDRDLYNEEPCWSLTLIFRWTRA